MAMRKSMAAAIGIGLACLVVSCAAPGPRQQETAKQAGAHGFLQGYYQFLTPGPEGGAKMRWFKPGVDFSRYRRIMLDSVVFYFAEDSEHKGIDARQMKELADDFNRKMCDTLGGSYAIVDQPGPDVLRVRAAITDIRQSHPGLSAVSLVTPVGLTVSAVRKGAGGGWSGSGATSAEFMALDSLTNEVVAVAQDERQAGFGERFTRWGSSEEAFGYWAQRIKTLVDRAGLGARP